MITRLEQNIESYHERDVDLVYECLTIVELLSRKIDYINKFVDSGIYNLVSSLCKINQRKDVIKMSLSVFLSISNNIECGEELIVIYFSITQLTNSYRISFIHVICSINWIYY